MTKGNQISRPSECPGCGSTKMTPEGKVWSCKGCGGLLGDHLYLGDSYGLVSPMMTSEPVSEPRYFDLSGVSSQGRYRRHGWYDPKTRLVVQAG